MATTGYLKGINVNLYKNVSGTYTKIGRGNTASFTLNTATIDVTNKDSDEWQELLTSTKNIEFSVEGVVQYDATGVVTFDTMVEDHLAGTEYELIFGTNASGDKYLKGNAYMTSLEMSASSDDRASFTASFSSTGAFTYVQKT